MAFYQIILIAILLIVLSLLSGCSHGGDHRKKHEYRVYVHDAHRGLFIRDLKDKDVLTYEKAHGLVCFSKKDLTKMVEFISIKNSYCKGE